MHTISRRGFFWMLSGTLGAGLVTQFSGVAQAAATPICRTSQGTVLCGWSEFQMLDEVLGRVISGDWSEKAYYEWFEAMELESFRNGVLTVSVPGDCPKDWMKQNADELLFFGKEVAGRSVERVDVVWRRV
jgi:hypothetical protein